MSKRKYDINGWPEIKKNPISKIGVFPYLGSSIGAPDPDKIYMVRRSKEELSSPEAIESFKLLPWIDDHTMLGGRENGYTPPEEKGIQGVTGEDVYFEGDTLYANLKLYSESQADLLESGKKELSLGYRCKYVKESGTYMGKNYDYDQINPRGNHIASVEDGRMGSQVAVLDSSDIITIDKHCFFTIDSQDIVMTKAQKAALAAKQKSSVLEAGKTAADAAISGMESGGASLSDETKQIIASLPAIVGASVQAAMDMAEEKAKDMEDDDKKKDAEDDDDDKKKFEAKDMEDDDKKKESKGEDSALITSLIARLDASELATKTAQDSLEEIKTNGLTNMLGEISRRDAMCNLAANVFGTFDHSEMTEKSAAVYIAGKLGLDSLEEGQELVAVNAALRFAGSAKVLDFVAQDQNDTATKSTAVSSYITGVK